MKAIIGVDPGPVAGLAFLREQNGVVSWQVAQATTETAMDLVEMWLDRDVAPWLAVERYVVGAQSARVGSRGANEVTRNMVGALQHTTVHNGLSLRSAADVKVWSTDERLQRAGVWDTLQTMRHAKDAARHALYCAVWDRGLSDPLLRPWTIGGNAR